MRIERIFQRHQCRRHRRQEAGGGVTPMMRRTKPELHINIFGIIGQDMQEIKDIITDTQSTFGSEYQLAFHVTFNPDRYQSRQRAGKATK